MKTALLYLDDTYRFSGTAQFVEMRENEKGNAVILDQTIFYPQGGGQPSDTGYIKSDTGIFKVTFVGLDADGVVWHFGEFESGLFAPGDVVNLEIDEAKRKLHARLHSAGHIVDYALQTVRPDLKADKGFHFAEGSYVEGDGEVEDTEALKQQIEERANEIVKEGLPGHVQSLGETDAKDRGFVAPVGKSVRIVGFGELAPCGCGGTHVINTKDIGRIVIRKIASKKGRLKISYAVE